MAGGAVDSEPKGERSVETVDDSGMDELSDSHRETKVSRVRKSDGVETAQEPQARKFIEQHTKKGR